LLAVRHRSRLVCENSPFEDLAIAKRKHSPCIRLQTHTTALANGRQPRVRQYTISGQLAHVEQLNVDLGPGLVCQLPRKPAQSLMTLVHRTFQGSATQHQRVEATIRMPLADDRILAQIIIRTLGERLVYLPYRFNIAPGHQPKYRSPRAERDATIAFAAAFSW
jgi:hypothetical protein